MGYRLICVKLNDTLAWSYHRVQSSHWIPVGQPLDQIVEANWSPNCGEKWRPWHLRPDHPYTSGGPIGNSVAIYDNFGWARSLSLSLSLSRYNAPRTLRGEWRIKVVGGEDWWRWRNRDQLKLKLSRANRLWNGQLVDSLCLIWWHSTTPAHRDNLHLASISFLSPSVSASLPFLQSSPYK